MIGVRRLGQKSSLNLMLALCARLEPFQAVAYAVVNPLVVAGLEVHIFGIDQAAPVSPKESYLITKKDRDREVLVFKRGDTQQKLVTQSASDVPKKAHIKGRVVPVKRVGGLIAPVG